VLRQAHSARLKLVQAISGSDCSLSPLWTTATGDTSQRSSKYAQGGTPLTLQAGLSGTDRHGKTAGGGGEFAKQVMQWKTPTTLTGGKESRSSKPSRKSGGENLQWQAAVWPTPVSGDHRSSVTGKVAKRNARPLCESIAAFLLDPKTSKPGARCSPFTPKLNPTFVEWLMGLPPGWTAYEPLATASFRSWQRLHSERLQTLLSLQSAQRRSQHE
jgi:hypothetical protein